MSLRLERDALSPQDGIPFIFFSSTQCSTCSECRPGPLVRDAQAQSGISLAVLDPWSICDLACGNQRREHDAGRHATSANEKTILGGCAHVLRQGVSLWPPYGLPCNFKIWSCPGTILRKISRESVMKRGMPPHRAHSGAAEKACDWPSRGSGSFPPIHCAVCRYYGLGGVSAQGKFTATTSFFRQGSKWRAEGSEAPQGRSWVLPCCLGTDSLSTHVFAALNVTPPSLKHPCMTTFHIPTKHCRKLKWHDKLSYRMIGNVRHEV